MLKILHLSDLHYVDTERSPRVEAGERGPTGNRALERTLDLLRDELKEADFVVISGDCTDTGSRAQWEAFLASIARIPGITPKIVLVPGNHDLNFVARGLDAFTRTDTKDFEGRDARVRNFLWARARLATEQVCEKPDDTQSVDIDDAFPAVTVRRCPSGLSIALIAINTVAPSITSFGNALGRFLVGRVSSLVQNYQEQGFVVVIVGHHHPLPFFDAAAAAKSLRQRLKDVLFGAGMESIDGIRFLDQLDAVARDEVLYLHGHKHVFRSHRMRSGLVRICGAPSLLFGDESTGDRVCVAARHHIRAAGGQTRFESFAVRT
ncbi:metallophosphoesterase family protein [Ramlibacter sp.]|uniref:metallophosphoesterase family protein n=1 Tax=Ramlibacter sp. TaxID=1917967 RepID=UPI0039C9FA4C